MRRTFRIAPVLVATAAGMYMVSPDTEGSCGSAFCTVNSDWTSESAITEPGSTLDLRYEYINQKQPQTGTDKIAVGQIPHHHDEVSTGNRNLLLSYSYTFDSNWGASVVAPFVDTRALPYPQP